MARCRHYIASGMTSRSPQTWGARRRIRASAPGCSITPSGSLAVGRRKRGQQVKPPFNGRNAVLE